MKKGDGDGDSGYGGVDDSRDLNAISCRCHSPMVAVALSAKQRRNVDERDIARIQES